MSGRPQQNVARRNVEIKARVSSLSEARDVAARLATERLGTVCQIDTFFHCSHGRLKLREVAGRPAELIAYARSDQKQPKPSEYHLAPVEDAAAVQAALTAVLGVACVVRKQREIFLVDNVRIHLDQVEGLGTFLEMEAVISSAAEDQKAAEQLDNLMREFGILAEDLLAGAYADMLSGGRIAERPLAR